MLFNACILAIVTFIGGCLVWRKLPRRVRRWLQKQDLITDVIMLCLAYLALGGTLTALLAASLVGVMVSVALYVANHPEQFGWLFQSIELVTASVKDGFGEVDARQNLTEGEPT